MTLDWAINDLGDHDHSNGLTLVAEFRARSLAGLTLRLGFGRSRLCKIGDGAGRAVAQRHCATFAISVP